MIEKRRKVEKPRNETLPHRENHDSPQPRARRQRRSASDLLSALAHLARDLGDTRHDEDSVASLAEACRRLFPGRLFDIHLVDPLTGEVRQVYANSRLSPLARGRLILTQGALGEVDPAVLARVKGHPLSIDVVPKYESVFEQSATGFDVAIHDHLALYGSVRVEYERPPTQAELASDRSAVTLLVRLMSNSLRASRLLEETLLLKDYLEKALEGAEAPMVVVDTTSRVTFVNNVFERLVSRSREELLGRPFLELIPNRDRTKLNALVASVLRGGPRRSVEVRYPSEEGRPAHHLSFTARPIAGAREEIEGVILVGQELTELRNLESQVIHSEKLATLGQVAAGVAHELNNPLTTITVYTEYLLRKLDDVIEPRDAAKLQRILEAAARIQGFTRDLVTYARPSGEEPIIVDLRGLVARALSFCEHILSSSKAEISVDIPDDVRPVYGIRGQLEQVIVNLVTNACQSLPSHGGKVRIDATMMTPERLRLRVIDSGRGIPAENLERVFDPFFTTKAEGQGTGLGLSIVRNILVNHAAKVSVESTVGEGTTFCMEIDAS